MDNNGYNWPNIIRDKLHTVSYDQEEKLMELQARYPDLTQQQLFAFERHEVKKYSRMLAMARQLQSNYVESMAIEHAPSGLPESHSHTSHDYLKFRGKGSCEYTMLQKLDTERINHALFVKKDERGQEG